MVTPARLDFTTEGEGSTGRQIRKCRSQRQESDD